MSNKNEFQLSVEIDKATGQVLAAYMQIRTGKAAEVKEHEGGLVFANYNNRGELLGVEMLGPCRVKVLNKIALTAPKPRREATKRFLTQSAPRELVCN